jgi:cytochrome c peroxidase
MRDSRTHPSRAAAVALLVLACGRSEAPARDATTPARANAATSSAASISSAPVQGAAIGAAELAMFARLPEQMTANGVSPTTAQVDLGRALYYDNRLSGNHSLSCNGCHPLNGFGADGRARSFGDHGQTGGRNAPTVYNAAGHIAQFWDGRAPSVEQQAKGPVLNPAEMGMPDSNAVLAHLRASTEYRAAFRAAYPAQRVPISYDNAARAIGAFERGLVTPGRWDRFLAGDRAALTAEEQRGLKTFVSVGCAGCHNGAYVGGGSFQKLGLVSAWPGLADSGRITVTRRPADLHVFKVAALRNVARTAPYFHDGAVATLPEAIRLMGRHQVGRELTAEQVRDIVAWLDALTGEVPLRYIAYPQLSATGQ